MTGFGIEPATFRLIAQCLSQISHGVPHFAFLQALKFRRKLFCYKFVIRFRNMNISITIIVYMQQTFHINGLFQGA